MGLNKTHIFSFIDYSSTINDSFEVGYSIIKNGGKGRNSLLDVGTLDKNFFEEMPYESFTGLYDKLFDRSFYSNLPIPRFAAKEVLVTAMGIHKKNNEDSYYKKLLYEDCFFEHSKITNPPISVFVKEVTCAKMISTPIWMYVDSSLIYSPFSQIGIFRMAINRAVTPTMCLLVVDVTEKEIE